MLQISVVVLAASQTRPPSNPVRGGGGVIGVVMGTAGTTERERLLVMWSRHAYDGVLSSPRVMDGPDQRQCVASRRVASRRVVLPVQLFRPNLQAQSEATWMLTWIYI